VTSGRIVAPRAGMGLGMGLLQIQTFDPNRGFAFEDRPFIIMTDHSEVDLGAVYNAAMSDDAVLAAVLAKDAKAAKAALDAGGGPDGKDKEGDPALHCAVALKSKTLVKLLLERGANVHATDAKGRTILHVLADDMPDASLGALAIDRGAKLDQLDRVNYEERAPLHRAVMKKKLDFAEMLVARGAAIDIADGNDQLTPLHLVIKSKSGAMSASEEAAALWLLDRGADPNAVNDQQQNALHLAARTGSHTVLEALFARGAKITCDKHGSEPLSYSLSTNEKDSWIWDLFLAKGCNLDHQDARRQTPVMRAQVHWNPTAVKYLLGRGADLSLRDEDGLTVLERATKLGQPKILPLLK